MSAHVAGLDADDLAEIVECLILGADHARDRAPELADRRSQLADAIGDALDQLPTPEVSD